MSYMNARPSFINASLPLPNPDDWLSTSEALRILDVTHVTLYRWSTGPRRILRKYTAVGSKYPMYWRADVEDLRDARDRAAGRTAGPR